VFVMLAVGVSYRQTIRAYPQGGGSYIVASEELGRVPGLMAAAGLLIDYIMTVAVSIASGVAAITSAYPSIQPATVWIGVGVIVILLGGNLRGVRQAGAMFVVPRSSEDVQRRRAAVPRRHRNGPRKGEPGLGAAGTLGR
jgi:amino acid transporter